MKIPSTREEPLPDAQSQQSIDQQGSLVMVIPAKRDHYYCL